MTDRLHSCKDAPDGRHDFIDSPMLANAIVCRRCHRLFDAGVRPGSPLSYGAGQTGQTITTTGWNAPAEDPDAHLGSVGGE